MYIARMPLVAASLVGFATVAATIALAQDNSNSPTPATQSASNDSATQSSGQSSSSIKNEGVQTDAQATQSSSAPNPSNLPNTKSGTTSQQSQAPVVDPNANSQNTNPQEWPAPQRYDAERGASRGGVSRQGGATLGVNVLGSEDGQAIVVARVRPGTPADQMGLRPGDRIISLNGKPVGSVDEFITAIRAMQAGDEVQLTTERSGRTREIAGRLAALREAIAVGEGPVGNIIGRAREFVRDQGERIGVDTTAIGSNVQTSFEDGRQNGRQPSGELESRLSRVEQEINQLMRDVSEIRASLRTNSATSTALPNANAAEPPSQRGPSAFRPTPGQPPNGLSPQSR